VAEGRTYRGRLASYKITEPGLAEITLEYQYAMAVQTVIVSVPADVLAGIVQAANRPAARTVAEKIQDQFTAEANDH